MICTHEMCDVALDQPQSLSELHRSLQAERTAKRVHMRREGTIIGPHHVLNVCPALVEHQAKMELMRRDNGKKILVGYSRTTGSLMERDANSCECHLMAGNMRRNQGKIIKLIIRIYFICNPRHQKSKTTIPTEPMIVNRKLIPSSRLETFFQIRVWLEWWVNEETQNLACPLCMSY